MEQVLEPPILIWAGWLATMALIVFASVRSAAARTFMFGPRDETRQAYVVRVRGRDHRVSISADAMQALGLQPGHSMSNAARYKVEKALNRRPSLVAGSTHGVLMGLADFQENGASEALAAAQPHAEAQV